MIEYIDEEEDHTDSDCEDVMETADANGDIMEDISLADCTFSLHLSHIPSLINFYDSYTATTDFRRTRVP